MRSLCAGDLGQREIRSSWYRAGLEFNSDEDGDDKEVLKLVELQKGIEDEAGKLIIVIIKEEEEEVGRRHYHSSAHTRQERTFPFFPPRSSSLPVAGKEGRNLLHYHLHPP